MLMVDVFLVDQILKSTLIFWLYWSYLVKFAQINRCYLIDQLFWQNTYLRNKKHTLTCQGGTDCYRAVNYQPGS